MLSRYRKSPNCGILSNLHHYLNSYKEKSMLPLKMLNALNHKVFLDLWEKNHMLALPKYGNIKYPRLCELPA